MYANWMQALEGAGFHYRTTVYRRYHAGRGTARGSVDSPSGTHTFAPLLATIVVYRGEWIRRCDRPHDLGHDDWLALAGPNGCWDDVPGEADPDHPAPFHIEMPRRLMKLYSWREDLVGDLFLGRGTRQRSRALSSVDGSVAAIATRPIGQSLRIEWQQRSIDRRLHDTAAERSQHPGPGVVERSLPRLVDALVVSGLVQGTARTQRQVCECRCHVRSETD